MKLPIIKTIVSNENLAENDLYAAVRVLETLAGARGLSDDELDVIGELISNIEGAKVVQEDHIHYGTPLREALNKFMQRVINSVK